MGRAPGAAASRHRIDPCPAQCAHAVRPLRDQADLPGNLSAGRRGQRNRRAARISGRRAVRDRRAIASLGDATVRLGCPRDAVLSWQSARRDRAREARAPGGSDRDRLRPATHRLQGRTLRFRTQHRRPAGRRWFRGRYQSDPPHLLRRVGRPRIQRLRLQPILVRPPPPPAGAASHPGVDRHIGAALALAAPARRATAVAVAARRRPAVPCRADRADHIVAGRFRSRRDVPADPRAVGARHPRADTELPQSVARARPHAVCAQRARPGPLPGRSLGVPQLFPR
jgi:hypothetical protein